MRTLLAAALLLTTSCANAAWTYFRPIDPHHMIVGAGFLVAPHDPLNTTAVTDLALITHSTADGTIIPESWQSIIPPESWVPLQVGFGGSFSGAATLSLGASANVAPVLAATLFRAVDKNSNGLAVATKTALAGSPQGGIRLGLALAGQAANEGHFQSLNAMFPGRGIGAIVGNAYRVSFGYAWNL